MTIKQVIRRTLNSVGFDAHRYCPSESPRAQLSRLFAAQKIDFVIDVGANVGQYARQLRLLGYQGTILSFEPLPDAHADLVRASDSDPLWHAAPRLCLSDSEGEISLNVAANGVSTSVLEVLSTSVDVVAGSACVRQARVPATTLDAYFERHPAPPSGSTVLLKLDVQGFEERVLAGAQKMLSWCQGVQAELSLVPLYAGQLLLPEMLGLLKSYGFELHALLPGFMDERTGRSLQVDGIFFRETLPQATRHVIAETQPA